MKMLARILVFLLLLAAPAGAQFADQRTWGGTASGTNAITISIPNYPSNVAGVPLRFKAAATNTGAMSLTINNGGALIGPTTMQRHDGASLVGLTGGEIVNGRIYEVVYDGAVYQINIPSGMRRIDRATSYTVTPGDCGTVQNLNGSGFYTVTIGAATGFPIDCELTFINPGSSARGRGMVVSGRTTMTLWQNQSQKYVNDNSGWRADPEYQIAHYDPNFFIDPILGSDDPAVTDGQSTGTGAYLTVQHANDVTRKFFFLFNGANATLRCNGVNYNQKTGIFGLVANAHIFAVLGDSAHPENCTFNITGGGSIWDVQDYGVLVINGIGLGSSDNAGTTGIVGRQHAIIDIDNMQWGSNINGTGVSLVNSSSASFTGEMRFVGNMIQLIGSSSGSSMTTSAVTYTVPPAVNVNISFWATANLTGTISMANITWNIPGATVAGRIGACDQNAVMNFGVTVFPGSLLPIQASNGCVHVP